MENQNNSATDEGSNVGPIVGGVVAALVIIVAAVVIVVIVVLYGRRKRGKFQGNGTTNPTYDVTGSKSFCLLHVYHSLSYCVCDRK